MNYYNEWDSQAAAWLRELIKAGHIPQGIVDERSITEVTPSDLAGFTQCHFFAGIGGWSRALQLAGVPATVPLWTGSPPCQPFSVAGAQVGFDDPRHLAPALLELIAQCRPPVVFGEQVSAAIGKHWLDFIFLDLEAEGYACGAAVLPAASVGAPHKRDRLFFGASLLVHTDDKSFSAAKHGKGAAVTERAGAASGNVADSDDARSQGRGGVPECSYQQPAWAGSVGRSMAHAGDGTGQPGESRTVERGLPPRSERDETVRPNPHNGVWSDADWLGCRDGKFRPVEPGSFPLANGIPARVGRLRGYGNAIVPQAAAAFIKSFLS